jgi:C4-dicarboxylate transporter, DctQ subunit
MKKFWRGLHQTEEYLLTLILLGLAIASCGQVFFRYALGTSFSWFEEGARYLGIVITFLGAAIGARKGSHFAMDLLISYASPRLTRAMKVAIGLLAGSFMALVAYYGMKVVMRNYEFENTTAALQLPMYLIYLPIPVFTAIMSIRFFRTIYTAFHPDQDTPKGGHI